MTSRETQSYSIAAAWAHGTLDDDTSRAWIGRGGGGEGRREKSNLAIIGHMAFYGVGIRSGAI